MPLLKWGQSLSRADKHAVHAIEQDQARPAWHRVAEEENARSHVRMRGWLETCAHPACQSGWLHPWRSRSTPVFEGGWTCSAECTTARMLAAVRREMDGRGASREGHRHRIPLGLLMLEQGWISQGQLRRALEAQKAAGGGRLGQWLLRLSSVSEESVTRGLALQWSCAVLGSEGRCLSELTVVMPRLFVDAFGALPLRVVAGRVLYLGFEERLDPVLALALERMSGMRVESGVVSESEFRPAHAKMVGEDFPAVELVEAAGETAAAQALARVVERTRPLESRLVRVHDCLWLRMWQSAPSEALPERGTLKDVVCSIGDM